MSVRSLAIHANGCVFDRPQLRRQLATLDEVISFLEEMNMRGQMDVPAEITAILTAAGVKDSLGLEPTALIPRVLDRRRLMQRRLTATGQARTTEPNQ